MIEGLQDAVFLKNRNAKPVCQLLLKGSFFYAAHKPYHLQQDTPNTANEPLSDVYVRCIELSIIV